MSSSRKKILITIDWYLPGYKAGGPIQSCANLVAHLKEECDFYVLTRDRDYCESKPHAGVTSNAWNRLEEHVWVYYFSDTELGYQNLKRVIQELKPDLSFINGVYSFYFSILPLLILKQLKQQDIIVSARGMLAPSAIQVKGGKKKPFLFLMKKLGFYKNVRFHATNEKERQDVYHTIGASSTVIVAPNLPRRHNVPPLVIREKREGELKLVSIARISPEKNTKYALEVLQGFQGVGRITFDLYGPVYDAAYWEECQEVIASLPDNVKVQYKGSLESALVAKALTDHHVLLMPTRGENFGHVIFESFSYGCPVIISDQTPWQQLERLSVGFDLPLYHMDRFVGAVQFFLEMNQQKYDRWSEQAYLYGQQHLQNKQALALNQKMFQ
ncbi:glycosyltransferase involved in cell wall biosynthesis [Pontibacter ummariensis]|uniref:Glycosyltransferase involved in cell wall bisynthesis n=1 Tax=Pontibacter ummariensis TaxID=1610492 RepID=A0A239BNY0_9BACT|nr:glycosyltransferase [Pontibacter ummariensis]PRY15743.1 glycosyltransferase involved in cell wall biosynthesis [Pontibacter ummariensis]SNS09078.1 Glycosyltransferase involved in cell wall bisynthesis [Pontibacter ummariensis]